MPGRRPVVATTASLAFAARVALAAACGGDDDPAPPPDAGPRPVAEAGPRDSGAGPEEGGSGPPPIPVDCPPGAAVERESNDTKEEATFFTELSFCGVIEDGSDVDYATFTTPEGRKLALFQAIIDGRVDFELTVNGKTFGPADTEQFAAGTYLVKAFTTDGEPGRYRFRIAFE